MKYRSYLSAICAFLIFGLHPQAQAQSPEIFYKTQTLILIVSATPSATYDSYERSLARHMPKHLAGAQN